MAPAYAHRKVQIVVLKKTQVDASLEVLLLQTNKDRGAFWQNITGNLHQEEAAEVGAQRELQEETGLGLADYSLHNLQLSFDYSSRHGGLAHEEVFMAMLKVERPILLSPLEHQGFEWLITSKAHPHTYFYPSNYEALTAAMEYVKKHKL